MPDNIPVGTNLGGATVKIYTRGDTNDSEWDNEQTGDIVDDAVYERNRSIEERLNVNLEYFCNTSADFWGDRNIYMDTVRASVLANDGSLDIAAGLSNIMPELAQEGMFHNLLASDMPYFDFDSEWWPKELVNELAIDGRLYMASGEVNLGVIKGVNCFFFNKKLIEENKLENPYDLVSSGKWTLDKFYEMAQGGYADINGSTAVDPKDQFGFLLSNENHALTFPTAIDIRYTEFDSEGIPHYIIGDEAMVDIVERIREMMLHEDAFIAKLDGENIYETVFTDGRAIFQTGEFSYAVNMRDVGFDFGIIPFPKGNEAQSDYVTTSRATYSLLGITVTASNKDNAAAVIEAIAAENHSSVTPAYFETALKVKYSRDDVSSQMFDLIRGNISFDFGIVHGPMMGNITPIIRQHMDGEINKAWTTDWAERQSEVESALENYIDKILSLEK